MSAFARALAALHRDVNLSAECAWHAGWARDAVRALAIDMEAGTYALSSEGTLARGIRSQEVAPAFGAGGVGGMTGREFIDIAVADLPDAVQRDDIVTIGADVFMVEAAERDAEALTWRITLSEAA